MVVAKVWKMKNLFHGEPTLADFEQVSETLPDLKDGGFFKYNTLFLIYGIYYRSSV